MTEPENRVRDRQAMDYTLPVVEEPVGGPIPPPQPIDEKAEAEQARREGI